MSNVTRRGLLKGLFAGAIVLGFDPSSRSWVTEARAQTEPPFAGLPPLDGTLTVDNTVRGTYADDFGHIIHRTPLAVLFPGSVQDIVNMVQYAATHDLKVVSRGRGHTTIGQAQTDAGVLIDMGTLSTIHEINTAEGYADVDAGIMWRDLLQATITSGLTPPILTDYTKLTVAGTLSVGGVSGRSYIHGAQVDNVLEVTVVTGEGVLVTCSATQNSQLFNAVLAGLGLVAIIVRVKLRLIAAKTNARTHRAFYFDIPSMLADMRVLIAEQRFDHLRGNGQPTPQGWMWFIEGTSFFTPGNEGNTGDPNARPLPANPFAGLNHLQGMEMVEDKSYFEYCDTIVQLFVLLEQFGLLGLPHPWLDLFVPNSQIDNFASDAVDNLDITEFMPGSIILFYPFVRAKLTRPLLSVPEESTFFLFDILQTTPPVGAVVAAALARNRALYDENVLLGGKHYKISCVQLSALDWKAHFSPNWGVVNGAKNHHDPDNILGTGTTVFD